MATAYRHSLPTVVPTRETKCPRRHARLGRTALVAGVLASTCLSTSAVGAATIGRSLKVGASARAAGSNRTPGTVWIWADGDIFSAGVAPAKAPGLSDVLAVAESTDGVGLVGSNGDTSYAVKADGTVWAWGNGTGSELGNGTTKCIASTPVQVHDLSGVVAIAGAGDGAYAVEGNGTVWPGAPPPRAALGNGEAAVAAAVPVRVHGLSGAVAVVGGGWAGYALLRDGSVRAWVCDVDGELGDGARASLSPVPVRVRGLSNVVSIAASESDGYAVLKDGSVWAWGANDRGQLGEGTEGTGTDVPVQVHGLSDAVAVAGYPVSDSIIALRKDGSVWHWGAVANYESIASNDIPERVPGLSGVVAVTAGYYTEFAALRNGTVLGWGDDEDGEMGNNTKYRGSFAPSPVQIQGLRGVIAVERRHRGRARDRRALRLHAKRSWPSRSVLPPLRLTLIGLIHRPLAGVRSPRLQTN